MVTVEQGDCTACVRDVPDGAVIMVGGFGDAGRPDGLLAALLEQGARELTVVSNNAGSGDDALARLLAAGRVRKVICSFPRSTNSEVFEELYRAGDIRLELVPQGTLSERIRAGVAGIPAFFTPTAVDTLLAHGKEQRAFDGRVHLLEHALRADFALIRAERADPDGNLVYHKAARNFGPIMAMAARTTIAEVRHVVGRGELDPEAVVTPGIFVDRVAEVPA
jgi:3-oxoadipate CoA-transferase alpha subunit